ncbi:MAG: GTP 3',8-cyclase MoaA [Candidatus Thermoplasmatota archaeon]
MKDPYGREITNLRVSLTQDCNLRCFYCHNEGEEERKQHTRLKLNEVKRLLETASEIGMYKVKFSGGEPLLHPEIEKIIDYSSNLMEDVSLTTNGVLLRDKAKKLKDVGLDRVNVSLDVTDPETYEKITGESKLSEVKKGIESANEVGLFPVKINMLLMEGLNDDSIEDMIEFASETGSILQIIEMTSNEEEIDREFYQKYHVSLAELTSELEKRAMRTKTRRMHARKKYFLENPDVEVELVRTMHNSTFCQNCTRLRVTSEAELKPCLLRADNHVSVRDTLKNGGNVKDKFIEAIEKREPYWCE